MLQYAGVSQIPISRNPLIMLWVEFVFNYWWLVPIFIVGMIFWPQMVSLIRRGGRRFSVGLRTSGIRRVPGMLYCALCGEGLVPETAGEVFAVQSCPVCGGKWCLGKQLTDGLAKKNGKTWDWLISKNNVPKDAFPCPNCLKNMQIGFFRGSQFTTFRCEACDGYWFDRIDWVSFEIGL